MRVATVFAGFPSRWRAGGPLMHWAAISALVSAGHEVTFVSLPWADDPPREDRIEAIRELGANVVLVPPPRPASHPLGRWRARREYLRSLLWPGDETLFP